MKKLSKNQSLKNKDSNFQKKGNDNILRTTTITTTTTKSIKQHNGSK